MHKLGFEVKQFEAQCLHISIPLFFLQKPLISPTALSLTAIVTLTTHIHRTFTMPPKRAPKPPVALVSTRASRSRTKTGATENTEASPAGTGKRKRTDAATMDNPAPDAEEAPQAKSKAKTVLKKSKIATKNPRTAVPKKVGVVGSLLQVEKFSY